MSLGVSGCFGSANAEKDPIDDIQEAAAAVDEIVNTDNAEETETEAAPNIALAQLVGQYARRVRLLTWAVVAIVIVMILREVDK